MADPPVPPDRPVSAGEGGESATTLGGAWLVAAVLGVVSIGVFARFRAALAYQRERVHHSSRVIASRFGQIEYAMAGTGPLVLVAHGAGGGFDQVISVAARLIAAGHQVIAPSRFGYLRSSSPVDATLDDQADAFVVLLEELSVQRLPVIGISVGALSALQFAARHPARCQSLTVIVPAASAAGAGGLPAQGPLPEQGALAKAAIERAVRSDFPYRLGMSLAPDRMIRLVLGTDPAVVAAAPADERRRARETLGNILPISARSRGFKPTPAS